MPDHQAGCAADRRPHGQETYQNGTHSRAYQLHRPRTCPITPPPTWPFHGFSVSLEFYPIGFCEAGRAPADGPLSSFERSGGSRRSRACGRRPPRRPCTSRSGAGVSRQHVLLAPAPGRSRRSCRCRSWSNGSRRPTTHRQPHPRARAPAPAQPLHGARRATLKLQRVAEKRLPKRHHRTIVCVRQYIYTVYIYI